MLTKCLSSGPTRWLNAVATLINPLLSCIFNYAFNLSLYFSCLVYLSHQYLSELWYRLSESIRPENVRIVLGLVEQNECWMSSTLITWKIVLVVLSFDTLNWPLQNCTVMVVGLWRRKLEILRLLLLTQNRECCQKLRATPWLLLFLQFLIQTFIMLQFHHKGQPLWFKGQGRELIRSGRVPIKSVGYTVTGSTTTSKMVSTEQFLNMNNKNLKFHSFNRHHAGLCLSWAFGRWRLICSLGWSFGWFISYIHIQTLFISDLLSVSVVISVRKEKCMIVPFPDHHHWIILLCLLGKFLTLFVMGIWVLQMRQQFLHWHCDCWWS